MIDKISEKYELRPCVIKGGKKEGEAYFHFFGMKRESDHRAGYRLDMPFALVELLDGSVMLVHPTQIRFMDREKEVRKENRSRGKHDRMD